MKNISVGKVIFAISTGVVACIYISIIVYINHQRSKWMNEQTLIANNFLLTVNHDKLHRLHTKEVALYQKAITAFQSQWTFLLEYLNFGAKSR